MVNGTNVLCRFPFNAFNCSIYKLYKLKVEAKSDSEDVRIYINGLLHIRFPRDKNVTLHSWIEGHSKRYVIDIFSKGHTERVSYDNRIIWEKVLRLIDKHI